MFPSEESSNRHNWEKLRGTFMKLFLWIHTGTINKKHYWLKLLSNCLWSTVMDRRHVVRPCVRLLGGQTGTVCGGLGWGWGYFEEGKKKRKFVTISMVGKTELLVVFKCRVKGMAVNILMPRPGSIRRPQGVNNPRAAQTLGHGGHRLTQWGETGQKIPFSPFLCRQRGLETGRGRERGGGRGKGGEEESVCDN